MAKRITAVVLIITILLTLSGCGGKKTAQRNTEKIDIVCTIFPAYDWINNIIGENSEKFNVTLISGGRDLHSFQPSASDILKIHTCDLFVYVGGVSDLWAEEVLDDSKADSIRLFDFVDESERIMTADDHHHEHEEHPQDEYDEHIWLSLRLAKKMVNGLCTVIAKLDNNSEELYKSNAEKYIAELDALDKKYTNAVEESADKTIIFADRFPFSYLTKDYGIKCVAAFSGCSSDTDADFETVARLAESVKKLNKDAVLVLENSNLTIANAVAGAAGCAELKTEVMNSCQSITNESALNVQKGKPQEKDIAEGMSYIKIMTENLACLKKALK